MIDLNKIKSMIENGFAHRHVAEEIGTTLVEIQKIAKEHGLVIKKEPFSDSQIPRIKGLYEQRVSAKNLGIKFGIAKSRVQKWAEAEGFLRDKNSTHRVNFFNEHIFDTIDTPEKAYWIGFLYADAYHYKSDYRLNLYLKSTDICHIKAFCAFMSYNDNLIQTTKIYDEKRDKEYEASGVTLHSMILSTSLDRLGCMQAKSFILEYPKWIAPELEFHFIRGIWDGDGCIKMNKESKEYGWRFAGTKDVCDGIRKRLLEEGITLGKDNNISKTGNNTWELSSSGNLKIHRICDLLYRDSTIHLDRKFQRFHNLRNMNIERHPQLFSQQKFADPIMINHLGPDLVMNEAYLSTLTLDERKVLVPFIVDRILQLGFVYPDNVKDLVSEYQKLVERDVDLDSDELSNHVRIGLNVCKYFCHSYYRTKTRIDTSIVDVFKDRNALTKLVENKLGLHGSKIENLNFSYQGLIHDAKKGWICSQISIFKPLIAKYMCLKYSEPGDLVGDYSAGFGGRLLGAMSCGRKYIGIDPLTASELQEMIKFFEFEDCEVIQSGSEYYKGKENSLDLCWSSPPYFDYEVYSSSLTQAYAKGEDYFHNVYWRKTLANSKFMLKPGKWFGVNVSNKCYKMIEIAKEYFGDLQEKIVLKSQRNHMLKVDKEECIYMFKNNK